jgi:degradative hydroxymethylglutaryl-CoA reductase
VYKNTDGQTLANRIIEAYEWAKDDPYRAITHNKGIMNGMDAVALACGQDWRAIEAACHGYCTLRNGRYTSMSQYWIEQGKSEDGEDKEFFCGSLELPVNVGTVGGALGSNPMYRMAMGLMGNPNAAQLAQVGFI